MDEVMDFLYQLEAIDRKIFAIRRQMGDLPLKKEDLQKKLNMLNSEIGELKTESDVLTNQNAQKETENTELRKNIESDKEYLKSVKSNEEYMMIVEGKEHKESKIKENENTILKNLQRIDEINEKIAKSDEDTIKDLENQLNDINNVLRKDEKEILILNQEREAIIRKLPEDINKKYNRIFTKRQGLPIVLINKAYCTGCFSEIPEQLVDNVKSMKDIYYCTQCGRILLWEKNVHHD